MLYKHFDGHIIRNELKHCYYAFVGISLTGLWLFSALMWKVTFIQEDSVYACIIVAVVFTIVSCLMSILVLMYSWTLAIGYTFRDGILINYHKLDTHCLAIGSSFFITMISLPFAIGMGKITEHFYLLSAKPFSFSERTLSGGLPSIKRIWTSEVILLPNTENVKDWIEQQTNISNVSQYPKIMYIQRSTGDGSRGDKGTVLLSPKENETVYST